MAFCTKRSPSRKPLNVVSPDLASHSYSTEHESETGQPESNSPLSLQHESDVDRHSSIPSPGHSFSSLSVQRPQAKLEISQPSDPQELEADRIADEVIGMEDVHESSDGPEVERRTPRLKSGRAPRRSTGTIIGANAGPNDAQTGADSMIASTLSGSGTPLGIPTRRFMEPRFGHDFSRVRVHTDEGASRSAAAIGAHAYTVGEDVVFANGRYAPGTADGDRLLAHELTHVVQQTTEQSADNARSQPESTVSRLVIQRDGDNSGGTPAPSPTTIAPLTVKNTFTVPDKELAKKDLSYVTAEFKFGGSVDFEATQKSGSPEKEPEGTTLKPAGGANVGNGGKYQAEVTAEFEKHTTELLGTVTPKIKLGGEAGAEGGKLGIEFSVENQTVEPKFAINFLEVEKGKFEFFNLEAAYDWKITEWTYPASDGTNIKITPKVTPKIAIEPNYAKLMEWLAREVAFDIAIDGAIIAVGVATIAATAYEMAYAAEEGAQEMQAALQAKSDIVSYCKAYDSVMKGYPPPAGGRAADGAAAASRILATKEKEGIPHDAVVAAARQSGRDFAMDVYPPVRQQTRQALITKWDSEHKVKAFLVHLAGAEGGGPLVTYFDQLVWPDRMPE